MGKALLISLLLMLTALSARAVDADSLFGEANILYQDKQYDQALEKYAMLERAGYRSAPLYFNIGNCYFKEGKPGYAILYYLKAKRIDPFDEDINTNLTFARQFMPTRLEGVQINPVTTFFDTIVEPFSLNNLAWISSLLFILFMLLWAARIYFDYSTLITKIALFSLLALVIISSGMTTYIYRTDYLTEKGVVVSDEARIFSGPGEDNDVEFVGGFGLEFEVERESGDYYLVLFENKRKGWIHKANIEII